MHMVRRQILPRDRDHLVTYEIAIEADDHELIAASPQQQVLDIRTLRHVCCLELERCQTRGSA